MSGAAWRGCWRTAISAGTSSSPPWGFVLACALCSVRGPETQRPARTREDKSSLALCARSVDGDPATSANKRGQVLALCFVLGPWTEKRPARTPEDKSSLALSARSVDRRSGRRDHARTSPRLRFVLGPWTGEAAGANTRGQVQWCDP